MTILHTGSDRFASHLGGIHLGRTFIAAVMAMSLLIFSSTALAQPDAAVADTASATIEGAPPEPADESIAEPDGPVLPAPATGELPDVGLPPVEAEPAAGQPAGDTPGAPVDGQQTPAEAKAEPADDAPAVVEDGLPWYLSALIVLAILIVPFWIGGRIAGSAKMPDHGWKVGLALCTIIAAIVIVITRWPPLYGPDLSGGINLIYQVDPEIEETKTIDMDKLIAAISRRVNPSGLKEVTIRPYGSRQVEIIVPKADPAEVDLLKKNLEQAGIMEFRITASRLDNADAELIRLAESSANKSVLSDEIEIGKWVRLDEQKFPADERGDFILRDSPNGRIEVLVKLDVYDVTGGYLDTTFAGVDETGSPSVNFNFTTFGAKQFADLTSDNAPVPGSSFRRHLGIVLDNELLSAPTLQEAIVGGSGRITGRFTQEEVDFLIGVLNAGSLPAALDKTPISEQSTSPTLGQDTIDKGKAAMAFSMCLIVVFMLVYYRFAGIVACLALASNIFLLLAAMIAFRAAFTLPGIAGLVLTVGMAVDANVLIFERIREELARGSALRLAIRNGFDRATRTIVDANLTTLITAIVLFWIGTDQIKGFAVTLILGIVMSMYTAIFCSRIVFEMAERVRRMTKLPMMRLLGSTSIDFLGKRRVAFVFSVLLIGLGMTGVMARRSGLLDIDFMGGSSVQILFNEPTDIASVRSGASLLPDLTVRGVGEGGASFAVDTSDRDLAHVEKTLEEAFAGRLVTNSLSHTPLAALPDAANGASRQSTELTFGEEIKYDSVEKMIDQAFEGVGIPAAAYVLSHPNYEPGSNQAYTQWDLSISLPTDEAETLLGSLESRINAMTVFPSASNIGGKVASDTQLQAAMAILASLVFIVAYIWIRFQHIIFGLAAVLALVHDVLCTLGILALSKYVVEFAGFVAQPLMIEEFKISLTIVAAFLTIVGYSLNDTIVVFDRIREVRGKSPSLTAEMINASINQTLSRTLLTSLTTLFVVVILYFGGGPGIHGFAFALTVGVLVGTYSSVFVASPALLWMMGAEKNAPGKPAREKKAKQVA